MTTWLNNIIEHPKTSLVGIILAVLTVGPVFAQQGITLGHAGTGSVIQLIVGVCTALLGLFSKDPSGPGTGTDNALTKNLPMLLLVLLLSMALTAHAQTGIPFSTATEATALNFGNNWYAADHTTESLDLFNWGAQKNNVLSVEGHQIIAGPTAGWNSYLGGLKYQPDITPLLSKSNVSSGLFQLYVQGAVGVATVSSGSQVSYILGGGAQYRLTENLGWNTVNFRYINVGGIPGKEISSGIAYYFNPAASKSLTVKRLVAARAFKQFASRK